MGIFLVKPCKCNCAIENVIPSGLTNIYQESYLFSRWLHRVLLNYYLDGLFLFLFFVFFFALSACFGGCMGSADAGPGHE